MKKRAYRQLYYFSSLTGIPSKSIVIHWPDRALMLTYSWVESIMNSTPFEGACYGMKEIKRWINTAQKVTKYLTIKDFILFIEMIWIA